MRLGQPLGERAEGRAGGSEYFAMDLGHDSMGQRKGTVVFEEQQLGAT